MELRQSKTISATLQRELDAARNTLTNLRIELKVQQELAGTSLSELSIVSGLLKQAENNLQNLTAYCESLLSEAASQKARANKAERRLLIWRIVAMIFIGLAAAEFAVDIF
jgi:hypothetical protein